MKLRDLLKEAKPLDTKTFLRAVNDEWDIESLELMKGVIDKRLDQLNKLLKVADPRVTVKGFRK